METQKATRGPEKPVSGRAEQNAIEQPASEIESHAGVLAAARLAGASIPPPGQSPNTVQRRPEIATMSTRHVLHLQRTIGNQATRRLMRQENNTPSPVQNTAQRQIHAAPAGSIQRGLFSRSRPVETDEAKRAWNTRLNELQTNANRDWLTPIQDSAKAAVKTYLEENLGSDERKEVLIAEIQKGINNEIAELERALDGQISTATGVAKEKLQAEKATVKKRLGASGKAMLEENPTQFKDLIDNTIGQLLNQDDIKLMVAPAAYVKKEIKALLDPKRDRTRDINKIKEKMAALKVRLTKDWAAEAKTKIKTYLKDKAADITNTFKAQFGAGPTAGTSAMSALGTTRVTETRTADEDIGRTVDAAELKKIIDASVTPEIEKYLAEKFGADGMSWWNFRSDEALEFREQMKEYGRQKAYKEIDAEKDTHARTSGMSTTGKDYIGHLAKNHAYKHAKKSVNSAMAAMAKAEAIKLVDDNDVLVRFGLDIGWRDAVTAAKKKGVTDADALKAAGIAGAKKAAPSQVVKMKEKAKAYKNQVFDKVGKGKTRSGVKKDNAEFQSKVQGQVTEDRVANRSITQAFTSDSITQGYNKLANLINFMVPTPGDEVNLGVEIRVPGPDGLSFFVFTIGGSASRDSAEEVKASLTVGIGGGLQFWGGDATFKVGYFVEAAADSANKIGMLMSYGTYRQMSSGPADGPMTMLADYLWGGRGIKYVQKDERTNRKKAGQDNRDFAEMWAAMVEETAMQSSFLPTPTAGKAPTAELQDVYRENEGQLYATTEAADGREYLGKVKRIAEVKSSITAGGFSFTYGPGQQAVKAAGSEEIRKGKKVYVQNWTVAPGVTLQLTTKESEGTPVVKNKLIGTVDEIGEAGKRIYTDSSKSNNYVDVGYLVEAAGKVNFGVGKAEGVASYKRLSRYSKAVIDKMAAGKFGTSVDHRKKREQLGLDDLVGGGQERNIIELEGKTEFGIGTAKDGLGLGGKFVWTSDTATHTWGKGFEEVEIAASAALPAEYLDENLMKTNMVISRLVGSFSSAAKTLVSTALEQKKKRAGTAQEQALRKAGSTEDKTGKGGKALGTLTDISADIFFPAEELDGAGLGDKMVKAGGSLGTTRKDGINHTVNKWFDESAEDTPLEDAINKFALKNELAFTLTWTREHGRNQFSVDIKQTKGGEVDLGVFKAKIEKSKELAKVSFGQEDKKYPTVPTTDAGYPGGLPKNTVVYLKDDKITKLATDAEKAGMLRSVVGTTATVRAYEWGKSILGFD